MMHELTVRAARPLRCPALGRPGDPVSLALVPVAGRADDELGPSCRHGARGGTGADYRLPDVAIAQGALQLQQ
jgi:hypothetical protein